nr:unnamed protein product [Callosobruchus chinensis]
MLKEKKMAHRKYKESMDEDDYNVFSSLRASCNRLRNCCYQKYICKVEDSISGSPYAFWKFINDKRNLSSIPSSMNYGDTTSNDISTAVDLFADYFSTVYNNINVNQTPTYAFSSNVNVSYLYIDAKDIITRVMSLPWKLSTGPDKIPMYFLKSCIFTLTKPLQLLFNKSLRSGQFPRCWKQSFLRPIFKSGQKDNVENYRAVCIQSEIPKLMDSLHYSCLS